MRLDLEINNEAKSPVRKFFLNCVALDTFLNCGYDFLQEKNINISIGLVGPEKIKGLNRIYRKKDSVTDVLSFSEYKSRYALEKIGAKNIFLGELIICYDDIERYCRKKKMDVKKELAEAVSHGILHLLGFRHGKKMFGIQKRRGKKTHKLIKND